MLCRVEIQFEVATWIVIFAYTTGMTFLLSRALFMWWIATAAFKAVNQSMVPDVTRRSNVGDRDSDYFATVIDVVYTFFAVRGLMFVISMSMPMFKDFQCQSGTSGSQNHCKWMYIYIISCKCNCRLPELS